MARLRQSTVALLCALTLASTRSMNYVRGFALMIPMHVKQTNKPNVGLQRYLHNKSLQATTEDASDENSPVIDEYYSNAETNQALSSVVSCSKWMIASAIVDVAVHFMEACLDPTVSTLEHFSKWLFHLRTLSKLGLAVGLMRAVHIYKQFMARGGQQQQQQQPVSEPKQRIRPFQRKRKRREVSMEQQALQMMRIMTNLWRTSTLVVTITAIADLVASLPDIVSQTQEGVTLVLVAITITAVFTSQWMATADPLTDFGGGSQNSQQQTGARKLLTQATLLARAMKWACISWVLQASLIPILALATLPTTSWHATVLWFLDAPTPLALATCLRSVRAKLISVLSEVTQAAASSSSSAQQAERRLLPSHQASLEWARAQRQFYQEAQAVLRADMIAKTLFLVSQRGVPRLLATFLAAKVG